MFFTNRKNIKTLRACNFLIIARQIFIDFLRHVKNLSKVLSFLFIIARYTESVSKEFATFTITIFIVKKLLSVLFFSMKSVSQ